MLRTTTFQLRVSDEERRVFKAVADRLQRDESDTIRLLVRNVAQELGVTAITADRSERRSDGTGRLTNETPNRDQR